MSLECRSFHVEASMSRWTDSASNTDRHSLSNQGEESLHPLKAAKLTLGSDFHAPPSTPFTLVALELSPLLGQEVAFDGISVSS